MRGVSGERLDGLLVLTEAEAEAMAGSGSGKGGVLFGSAVIVVFIGAVVFLVLWGTGVIKIGGGGAVLGGSASTSAPSAAVESMRVDPPDLPQPVAFASRPLSRVIEGTTCIPKQLYLALNYGRPVAERVPASQGMIDSLHHLFDNSKDQPPIGGSGAFSLARKPGTDVIQEFGAHALASVAPRDMHRVVVVVECSSAPTYKVYAFIDRGVDWNGPRGDFCDPGAPPCIRSDVWVASVRDHRDGPTDGDAPNDTGLGSGVLQRIPEEGWCH